jgi:hypothetical protein
MRPTRCIRHEGVVASSWRLDDHEMHLGASASVFELLSVSVFLGRSKPDTPDT